MFGSTKIAVEQYNAVMEELARHGAADIHARQVAAQLVTAGMLRDLCDQLISIEQRLTEIQRNTR